MEVRDRYITFENIDCYENAKSVLDAMYELFSSHPGSKNAFWERFEKQLPENYRETPVDEEGRDTLYQVCSNVFYIEELFDEYECEKGLELLKTAEFDCC